MREKSSKKKRKSAEISFRELLLKVEGWIKYLRSKWVTIFVSCILGAIVGYTVSVLKKPVFIADSTFVLEDADKYGGLGQYAGLASMVGLNLNLTDQGGIFQGNNIIELYKSNAMIEKTLLTEVDINGKKELLIDRYIEFNKLREKWAKKPELKNLKFSAVENDTTDLGKMRVRDSVMATVISAINDNYLTVAKPDKQLNIIKAEVKSPDELFAKNFDEQIVKNVNDYYIQTKTIKALRNVRLLQQKTDSLRAVMDGATSNVNASRKAMGVAPKKRSQFSAETDWGTLSELVTNLEMSKIALQKQTPLIQVIDKPKFPLERNSISPLEGIVFGFLAFGILTTLGLWLKKLYIELKSEVE
jgi:uncharacterized protein involved in exopolysaccharide biosynthesis